MTVEEAKRKYGDAWSFPGLEPPGKYIGTITDEQDTTHYYLGVDEEDGTDKLYWESERIRKLKLEDVERAKRKKNRHI